VIPGQARPHGAIPARMAAAGKDGDRRHPGRRTADGKQLGPESDRRDPNGLDRAGHFDSPVGQQERTVGLALDPGQVASR
jgi:hypothetical protein